MASYRVLTPLRHDGERTEPGRTVDLDPKDGDALVELGAVEAVLDAAAPAPGKPLARMSKAELLATAAAEQAEVAADATNAALIAAIEAKRAEAASS